MNREAQLGYRKPRAEAPDITQMVHIISPFPGGSRTAPSALLPPAPRRQAGGLSTPCPESLRHSPWRSTPTPPCASPCGPDSQWSPLKGGGSTLADRTLLAGVLSHFGLPTPFLGFRLPSTGQKDPCQQPHSDSKARD